MIAALLFVVAASAQTVQGQGFEMMGGEHVALQLFSFWDAERKSYNLQKIEEVPSVSE